MVTPVTPFNAAYSAPPRSAGQGTANAGEAASASPTASPLGQTQAGAPRTLNNPNALTINTLQLTLMILKLAFSLLTGQGTNIPATPASAASVGGSPASGGSLANGTPSSQTNPTTGPSQSALRQAPSQIQNPTAQTATGVPPQVTGTPPSPTPTPPAGHQPVVAEIDDFSTDNTGFNHGAEIANTINPDGRVQLLKFNIAGTGDRLSKISSALDEVIARVKNGETIDAVNLSQQDFSNSPQTAQIRAKMDQLVALGVAVDVAAGNGGPGQHNSLVSSKAFSVASTTNGITNPDSGIGNVSAEGRSTSFATANFTRQIALQRASGQ